MGRSVALGFRDNAQTRLDFLSTIGPFDHSDQRSMARPSTRLASRAPRGCCEHRGHLARETVADRERDGLSVVRHPPMMTIRDAAEPYFDPNLSTAPGSTGVCRVAGMQLH
jgi:hypothetical protein